MERVYYSYENC